MKKVIFAFCLLLSIYKTSSAQNYSAAIGTRLGFGFGLTGKWSPNQNLNFLEGLANFDLIPGVYGRYTGVALTALYERHFEMPRSFDGLNWYIGGGGGFAFGAQFFNMSVDPIIGLEYSVRRFNLNMSFDFKPRLYIFKNNVPGTRVEPRDAAFAFRYYF